MKKLNSKQLKMLRNIIIVITIVVGFIIWKFVPDMIRNSSLFHVGNAKWASKKGALILLLLPFFALIPGKMPWEIHSDDPAIVAELTEKWKVEDAKRQIVIALMEFFVIVMVLGLAILLG